MKSAGVLSDADLSRILLDGTPLLDVRAPIEYAHGSIPGAVNLPLLNDEERAAVGTCYKNQGQEAAITLGLKLVSGDVAETRILAWSEFIRQNPQAYLYCFRGGLRSQSVQKALQEAGMDVPLIPGGYKRVRQFLIASLERICTKESFAVLSGHTGSGKTTLLQELMGFRRVVDLEKLARHRGSAFGRWPVDPPSQADFENQMTVELLRASNRTESKSPIVLEDESRKIGRTELPACLFARIETAPVYVIERSREKRARHLIELYLSENYGLQEGDRDSAQLARLSIDLEKNLQGIARKLGGLELKNMTEMVSSAMAEQARTGSRLVHMDWVIRLLERYYDPLYAFHLERIRDRIVFQGSEEEVLQTFRERQ